MRFLVTGGAGLIGSHLSATLIRRGHEVLVLDSFRFFYQPDVTADHARDLSYRFNVLMRGAQVHQCSLSEKRRMAEAIAAFAPNVVIHLAAIPLVGFSTLHEEEASATLSEGLINLLEIVRSSPSLERFVYVSSSMVYGNFERDPMPEDGRLDPISIYGGLKLAGEILTRAYLKPTSIEHCIVRPSCIYGPTDTHLRVVPKFCRAAMTGGAIDLTSANDQLIDLTYIDDAVEGLVLAATHPDAANEVFNLSFGQGRTLSELVDFLASRYPGLQRADTRLDHADRPRRGTLAIDKARQLLGYNPIWSMELAVPLYLGWLNGEDRANLRLAAV
jgi:nucleoside-diphosphate-sugar epimerase